MKIKPGDLLEGAGMAVLIEAITASADSETAEVDATAPARRADGGIPSWHALLFMRVHGGIPSWHALIFTRVLGGIPPWHALIFMRVHGGSRPGMP